MSTRTLVERIHARVRSMNLKMEWTRNTGALSVLKLLEQGQDELIRKSQKSQVWLGVLNNGFPPYLETTAGITRYDIITENLSEPITVTIAGVSTAVRAKQVQRVFIDVTSGASDYGVTWVGDPVFYNYHNPLTSRTDRLFIAPISISQSAALENTPAFIQFNEDPGTTTEKYFVEFTWEAPRLTSETVPLIIPTEFESALEDFAMGTIVEYETGGESQFMARFIQYRVPEFVSYKNCGAKANNSQVLTRFC